MLTLCVKFFLLDNLSINVIIYILIMNVEYITTAFNKNQFPLHTLPEVAFVGKSNVGKSSLINTLVNRKKLAYTSNTPGKTKTINFFKVNENLCFVDLPGYGFAKVPYDIKKHWQNLIESYIIERTNLKLAILIVDIRHKPGKDDILMKQWLNDYGINTIIIATKADKLSKTEIKNNLEILKNTFSEINNQDIILFSSKTGEGKKELWGKLSII